MKSESLTSIAFMMASISSFLNLTAFGALALSAFLFSFSSIMFFPFVLLGLYSLGLRNRPPCFEGGWRLSFGWAGFGCPQPRSAFFYGSNFLSASLLAITERNPRSVIASKEAERKFEP